jgi:hypothetical protein
MQRKRRHSLSSPGDFELNKEFRKKLGILTVKNKPNSATSSPPYRIEHEDTDQGDDRDFELQQGDLTKL